MDSYELYYRLSAIAFALFVLIMVLRDRKHFERSGIMFMRKTEKGKEIIDSITKKSPRLWRFLGTLGVATGILGMCFGTYTIANVVYAVIFLQTPISEAPSFVLPTFSSTPKYTPGLLQVPFWPWIISIMAVMLIHEVMHAIQMRNENVPIKSSGLLVLAVIPGAFVEPDEEELKKKGFMQRQRIYAAGSFGNFALAAVVWALIFLLVVPPFFDQALVWGRLSGNQTFPAEAANMTGGMLYVDGQRVLSHEDVANVMQYKKPNDTVSVKTTQGEFILTLTQNPDDPSRGFMGIAFPRKAFLRPQTIPSLKPSFKGTLEGSFITFLFELLSWLFLLNFGIGIMNLIPLKPLDGGLMFEAAMQKWLPKISSQVTKAVSALMLMTLVSALLLSFL